MNIEELRDYCLSKAHTTEGFPFDDVTLVFKVHEKMFALTSLNKAFTVNLKCDPEKAIQLRERHHEIIPGFHMSKKHWNTINLEGTLSDQFVHELIDHSYDMVWKSLPKKLREL